MCYAKYDGKDTIYKDKDQVLKKTGLKIEEPTLPPKNLVKLTGTLSDFKGIFCFAQLGDGAYLSEEQREKQKAKLQKGALLATLNGNTAAGLAALGHAEGGDRSNLFPAQYITAKLDHNITLKGWLGFYKFNEGDQVEVVAEKHDDYYEVYAILKPSEHIISIIPLCLGGRKQLFKYFKLPLFLFYVIFTAIILYFFGSFNLDDIVSAYIGSGILFGPAYFLLYKKSISTFALLSEQIFTVLGWQNVANINLISISRQYVKKLIASGKYSYVYNDLIDQYIKPTKSGEGLYFFYYDPEVLCKEEGKSLSDNNKKTQHEDGQ